MDLYIYCGKGGVGKTTSAVSLAIDAAESGKKVAIVDADGGHSVARTLGYDITFPHNVLYPIVPETSRLCVAIIEPTPFVGIVAAKEQGWSLRKYLQQFPDDLGILPLVDMVNLFFGVPTDVATLEKFVQLTRVLHTLHEENYDEVVIDVEPTAGLERLLNNAEATARSLRNLQNQGIASLLAIGVKWPDIAAYLKGAYIKKGAHYAARIEQTVRWLRDASYSVVCTPERSPIEQTRVVAAVVRNFGGHLHCYVVNNVRGEPDEQNAIARLPQDLPMVLVQRNRTLHSGGSPYAVLRQNGATLRRALKQ